jgi:alkanesulfonate monooxygenase SsuD/methylene tetrahydromethanopterin reductase-like flavin-dependent oxidoreductase (luciferase family)
MSLEFGVYSFGHTPRTPDSGYGPTAQAVRDVLEAVKLAEDAGLDFFGFGEHHMKNLARPLPPLVLAIAVLVLRLTTA